MQTCLHKKQNKKHPQYNNIYYLKEAKYMKQSIWRTKILENTMHDRTNINSDPFSKIVPIPSYS